MKAVEQLTIFLEEVGRSIQYGHGTFGFMVTEDICSPGSPGAAPLTSSAPVETWIYRVKAESRED
jgi:hypothetical protein